jgi:hypothetical protein
VVVHKPRKPEYTAQVYRPIALLSMIGKALEAIVTTRLSYLVEAVRLLPANHVRGQRGHLCEHAIYYY